MDPFKEACSTGGHPYVRKRLSRSGRPIVAIPWLITPRRTLS